MLPEVLPFGAPIGARQMRAYPSPISRTSAILAPCLALLAPWGMASSEAAEQGEQALIDALSAEIAGLRARGVALERRLDADAAGPWLNEARADELRGIVADVLADASTRTALQDAGVSSGYAPGDGFQIASNDGGFTLRINGQLQVRWVLNHNPSGQDYSPADFLADQVADTNTVAGSRTGWGFGIRRAKVKFQGTVFDPSWSYQVNGAFGSTTGVFNFQDVMITKAYDSGLEVSVGQFKTPFMREELVSSRHQLAVDRSMVNAFFNSGRGVGVDVRYRTDQFSLEGAYTNGMRTALSSGQMNTNSSNDPTDYAFAARAQWKIAGDWDQFESFNAAVDQSTGVMVGVAGMIQEYNSSVSDQTAFGLPFVFPPPVLNNADLNGTTVQGVTADISAKFGDFSLFGAVVWQQFEISGQGTAFFNPAIRDYTASKVTSWGAVLQGGYAVCPGLELFARYAYTDAGLDDFSVQIDAPALPPSLAVPLGNSVSSILTIGANHFINDNVKLTVDWGINLESSLVGVSENSLQDLGWGYSNAKDQWVLRAQLQLLF